MSGKIGELVSTHVENVNVVCGMEQQMCRLGNTVVQSQIEFHNTLFENRKWMEDLVHKTFHGEKNDEKKGNEPMLKVLDEKIQTLVGVQEQTMEQLRAVHFSARAVEEKNVRMTQLMIEVHLDSAAQELRLQQSAMFMQRLMTQIALQNAMLAAAKQQLDSRGRIIQIQNEISRTQFSRCQELKEEIETVSEMCRFILSTRLSDTQKGPQPAPGAPLNSNFKAPRRNIPKQLHTVYLLLQEIMENQQGAGPTGTAKSTHQ